MLGAGVFLPELSCATPIGNMVDSNVLRIIPIRIWESFFQLDDSKVITLW